MLLRLHTNAPRVCLKSDSEAAGLKPSPSRLFSKLPGVGSAAGLWTSKGPEYSKGVSRARHIVRAPRVATVISCHIPGRFTLILVQGLASGFTLPTATNLDDGVFCSPEENSYHELFPLKNSPCRRPLQSQDFPDYVSGRNFPYPFPLSLLRGCRLRRILSNFLWSLRAWDKPVSHQRRPTSSPCLPVTEQEAYSVRRKCEFSYNPP